MTDAIGPLSIAGVNPMARPSVEEPPPSAETAPETRSETPPLKGDAMDNVEKIDQSTLAGPPPAFQVSLIELDQALRDSLSRMDAAQAFGAREPIDVPKARDAPSAGIDAQTGETDMAPDDTAIMQDTQVERPDERQAAPLMTGHGLASTVDVPLMPGEEA